MPHCVSHKKKMRKPVKKPSHKKGKKPVRRTRKVVRRKTRSRKVKGGMNTVGNALKLRNSPRNKFLNTMNRKNNVPKNRRLVKFDNLDQLFASSNGF